MNTVSTQNDETPGEAGAVAKPNSKKKLMIIGGAAAVVLLGGGGGAFMMMGGKAAAEKAAPSGHGAAPAEGSAKEGGEGAEGGNVPLDVPPILVNLRSPDGQAHFLKLHVMLIPGPKSNFEDLKKKLPILMDAYQPYLRELRPEDLSGSASVYRLKEEMMLRSAQAIGDEQVQDVLIQDLVQQ